MDPLPYKISSLVFIRHTDGRLLLLKRTKAPNKGLWSPIGGKLEMATGESPHESAVREAHEEVGLRVTVADLHLFSMIAEKNYEDRCHWLMFLFDCRKALPFLPGPIDEGEFGLFNEAEIEDLDVPATDRQSLWKIYFKARHDFIALRADCRSDRPLTVEIDESMTLVREKA